jgi:hypothetical protein
MGNWLLLLVAGATLSQVVFVNGQQDVKTNATVKMDDPSLSFSGPWTLTTQADNVSAPCIAGSKVASTRMEGAKVSLAAREYK